MEIAMSIFRLQEWIERKTEGNRSPRRTALKTPQKVPCPNSLPL
jgi:hypothetical protein